MKKLGLLVLAIAFFAANSVFALSLTLENKTGKELHELYFTTAGDTNWGPDQLGEHVVGHDETFTLQKIKAGHYDIMFVDEDGAKCDIRDVDFSASEVFVMTKKIIKGCQNATAEAEEDEEE